MIVQADAEAVICSAGLFSLCSSIQGRYDRMKEIVVIRPANHEAVSFEHFMEDANTNDAESKLEACVLDPKQTACIVYTSRNNQHGKTGYAVSFCAVV